MAAFRAAAAGERNEVAPDARHAFCRDHFIVAAANRTTGAVIGRLLEGAGRATRSMSREQAMADLAAGAFSPGDVLLLEVIDAEQIEAAAVARGNQGPALVAIAGEGRSKLRPACERAGFAGFLAAPLDFDALRDVVDALASRSGLKRDDGAQESNREKAGPIDLRALDTLAGLGGADFVHDIASQFVEDAAALLRTLRDASRAQDTATFRDHAHALRSCAANVGANGLYARCLALRDIGPRELSERGENHLALLERDLEQARNILLDYLARR